MAPDADQSSLPLLVFVHVPKTAGSTVNKILNMCAPGQDHCEHFISEDVLKFATNLNCEAGIRFKGNLKLENTPTPLKILELGRRLDWISAHVQRDILASRLSWLGRPIEYFAVMREPIAQLLSNLNWRFEIANRGMDFFLGHNLDNQMRSMEAQATDFTKPAAILDLLLKNGELFFNSQSRYILGSDFASLDNEEIGHRLATYHCIATEHTLPRLFRSFGFVRLPPNAETIHENKSTRYHFDVSVFQDPKLRALLNHYHRHDIALYERVRKISWPAENRAPFRPYVGLATPENFNEQAYLAVNSDVAAAVEKGVWPSGRAHFDAFGHGENRRLFFSADFNPLKRKAANQ